MPQHPLSTELLDAAAAAGTALTPAAIGAAVAQLFKRGLSYGERLIQILVGIVVSYFVGGAINSIFDPSPFVAQAIGFVVAMIAYEATPKFIQSAAEVVASLPAAFRDKFLPTPPPPPRRRSRARARPAANDNERQEARSTKAEDL